MEKTKKTIEDSTPIAMLTVGQLREVLTSSIPYPKEKVDKSIHKHVYGLQGLANLFGCSVPTANRIKSSGRIDAAIKQIGRKIIVDADLALELAGRKTGGRK